MASPPRVEDVEAGLQETQPLPSTRTPNTQPPASTVPQSQVIHTNELQGDASALQTANNSAAQQGMLTCSVHDP